jgi:hypothetical protein
LIPTNNLVFRQANLRLLTASEAVAAGGRLRESLSWKKQGEFQKAEALLKGDYVSDRKGRFIFRNS